MRKISLLAVFLMFVMSIKAQNAQQFKVWQTVKVGTFKNQTDLVSALKETKGFWANTDVEPALLRMTLSKSEKTITLVVTSAKELGCKNNMRYADLCKLARAKGLEPCPQETAAQLMLQRQEELLKTTKEWWNFDVVMDPLKESEYPKGHFCQNVFNLNFPRDNAPWPPVNTAEDKESEKFLYLEGHLCGELYSSEHLVFCLSN